jgi:hypothetical protein
LITGTGANTYKGASVLSNGKIIALLGSCIWWYNSFFFVSFEKKGVLIK